MVLLMDALTNWRAIRSMKQIYLWPTTRLDYIHCDHREYCDGNGRSTTTLSTPPITAITNVSLWPTTSSLYIKFQMCALAGQHQRRGKTTHAHIWERARRTTTDRMAMVDWRKSVSQSNSIYGDLLSVVGISYLIYEYVCLFSGVGQLSGIARLLELMTRWKRFLVYEQIDVEPVAFIVWAIGEQSVGK